MTRLELAKKLDVSSMTIYRWESGQVMPSPEHVGAIYRMTTGKIDANVFFGTVKNEKKGV